MCRSSLCCQDFCDAYTENRCFAPPTSPGPSSSSSSSASSDSSPTRRGLGQTSQQGSLCKPKGGRTLDFHNCAQPDGNRCAATNWAYDCAVCNNFCFLDNGLPLPYSLPSMELGWYGTQVQGKRGCAIENQLENTADPDDYDESKLGNYCCSSCQLWRTIVSSTDIPRRGGWGGYMQFR